jgi:uncharacterized protein YdbL (DUF1318 family)
VRVFAIMSTFSANGINLADTAQLVGESMEGWLRGFEGYAGLLILTNQDENREAVRNSLAERLGVKVESVESYEVSRRADLALG